MFKKLCFIIIFIFCSTVCFGLETTGFIKKDYVTYFGTTNKSITVGWDASEGADQYEVELYHVEQKRTVALGKTTQLTMTFMLDKSGHYTVRVRALINNCTENCESEWAESINPEYATVDGQPRAWWIYGHVASAGPINISKEIDNGKVKTKSVKFSRVRFSRRGEL